LHNKNSYITNIYMKFYLVCGIKKRKNMRKIILIITLTLGLFSCNNKAKIQKENQSKNTLQIVSTKEKNWKIFIKDKKNYSTTFIDELNASNYSEPIKLIDNHIIVGKDTTDFPHDLNIDQTTVFKATKDKRNYDLTVTRINETTLKFIFKLTDNEQKTLHSEKGEATLGAMFFLASEVDEDEQTGEAYGSSEYWKKKNDSWLSIRVGGKDNNGKLRSIITYGCSDKKKKELNLDECPILRTE